MGAVNTAVEGAGASAAANPSGEFAVVAAAAQALVSGLPPSPAMTLMSDALVGAGAGASVGAAVGSLIPGVGNVVGGIVGAEAGAVIGTVAGVVPMLEADHWNFLRLIGQLSASGVGAGAAAGAAAGSFIPVVGTGVGALAGAVVGDLVGATDPPIEDIRYLSEKVCFPAVAPIPSNGDVSAQGVFAFIPGQFNSTYRALSRSTFYQTQGGQNSAWSNLWAMLVSWRSPSCSTSTSRRAAWTLAQYYCRKFSARLGHDTSTSMSWESVVSVFGSSSRAAQALLKLTQWYGDPTTFSTSMPFAKQLASGSYKACTGYMPPGIPNSPQGCSVVRGEFERHPLDYLYYPIGVRHSGHNWSPAATASQTDVLLTFDGLLCTLAECAYLDFQDALVFHLLVQLSYWWVRCRKMDAAVFHGLDVKNHPNFSRCLALVAGIMRRTGVGLSPRSSVAIHGEPAWDSSAPAPTGATVRVGPGTLDSATARGGSSVDPSSPLGAAAAPASASGQNPSGALGDNSGAAAAPASAGGQNPSGALGDNSGGDGFPWLLAGAGVAAGAVGAVAVSRSMRRSP
jgi:hypothetical protein